MQYRFYLNGTLVNENPEGWDRMRVRIKRDKVLKGVLQAVDATLTFTADGYDFIRNIYDTDGSCEYITLSVHRSIDDGQNFIEKYKGLLFISDMKFDEFNCSVQTEFTDDSFYAKIDNRRAVPLYLTADKTVNDLDITPCTVHEMSLFDPATAVYGPILQPNGCIRVFDALQYLVAAVTDNDVEFSSPLFGTSGDYANLMLTYGLSIRQTGNSVSMTLPDFVTNLPSITFENLFAELNKRLNIGFYIDNTGSKPKVVIDYWKELFRDNTIATFPDLPNLKTEFAKEEIYVTVILGGNKSLILSAASFPGDILFLGFKKEELPVAGKCNTKSVLDLSYNFISDTNIIEQILVLDGTDDSYDKDWFLIECNAVFGEAKQSNWIDPSATERYYNEGFTNASISENYYGAIPSSIAQYLGGAVGDARFEATLTQRDPAGTARISGGTSYTPIKYNNEVSDLAGVYDPAVFQFTAPANGAYSFYGSANITSLNNGADDSNIRLVLNRYTSGMVLISTTRLREISRRQEIDFGFSFNRVFINGSKTIYCDAGDVVELGVTYVGQSTGGNNFAFSPIPVFPLTELSTFRCTGATGSGGILQTYDISDYPIIRNIFLTEIKQSQTDAITADPLSLIAFYIEAANTKQAWIDDVIIDEFAGTINAKLLSARNGIGERFPPEIRYVIISGNMTQNPFTMSPTDSFGNGSSDTTIKCYFFEVGKEITVTIPATFGGTVPNPGQSFILTRMFTDGSQTAESGTGTSFTFTVESGIQYLLNVRYDWTVAGNTFPLIRPFMFPPTVPGGVGIMSVTPLFPAGTYTYLWSNGSVLNQISGVAGSYTCLVTCTTCALTNNSITYHFEMPNSETGV